MRLRRAVLVAPMAVVALTAAAPAVSHAAPGAGGAATSKNANFKGTWDMSNGYSFTVKRESPKAGTCKGTTSYGSAYKFGHCKVHGHRFSFRITAKSDGAYSSYRGKFKKHSLHGVWTPEGSHGAKFTATRAKVK